MIKNTDGVKLNFKEKRTIDIYAYRFKWIRKLFLVPQLMNGQLYSLVYLHITSFALRKCSKRVRTVLNKIWRGDGLQFLTKSQGRQMTPLPVNTALNIQLL